MATPEPIYLLIAAHDGDDPWRTRVWGWYPTKELAEKDIQADNHDLIFESGSFRYAIIEEVPMGFMGGADDRKTWWFEADYNFDSRQYTITMLEKCPDAYAGVSGFGMG